MRENLADALEWLKAASGSAGQADQGEGRETPPVTASAALAASNLPNTMPSHHFQGCKHYRRR